MIFVTDKGRLCNNIIQYGHLYAWGREHNRRTLSMRFAYKYPEFHISHTRYHNALMYVIAKYAAKCKLIPTVEFNDINSDYQQEQQVMLNSKHVLATGWCVRFPDLFQKYKSEILQLFAFDEKVEKNAMGRLIKREGRQLNLGVHIRRGDYATWCGGHYFYNDQQYAHVIRQFSELFPDTGIDIYICGNDPQLDREYYSQLFGADHVHFPDGTPAEDLCLLSHCDYLIGAPSTFSLVASMYHDAPLYWIIDPQKPLEKASFDTFDHLFRQFDDLYIPA